MLSKARSCAVIGLEGALVEVEVDTLEQLREVLKVDGIDIVLLDNMDCPKMQEAVELRDRSAKSSKVELEASGGVTLETVRSIALTGVDRISVGAITHSSPAQRPPPRGASMRAQPGKRSLSQTLPELQVPARSTHRYW